MLLKEFEQHLRQLDLGPAYIPVLQALDDEGPLTQRELAERANVEQPTMAALLGRMTRDGLIALRAHPDDRRARLVSLTPMARKRLPLGRALLIEVAERATHGFTKAECTTLVSLLQRMITNLEGPAGTEE